MPENEQPTSTNAPATPEVRLSREMRLVDITMIGAGIFVLTGIAAGAFLIAFGALAFSFVLAFGLGSRHAVEKMWEEHMRQRKEQREREAEQSRPK
jgi:hypothetical protein